MKNIVGIKEDNLPNNNPKNRAAQATIQANYIKGPLNVLENIENAKVFQDLFKKMYRKKGFTSKFLILQDFFNKKLEDYSSIKLFINKIKDIDNQLKAANIYILNKIILIKVLTSLNSSYSNIVTNII